MCMPLRAALLAALMLLAGCASPSGGPSPSRVTPSASESPAEAPPSEPAPAASQPLCGALAGTAPVHVGRVVVIVMENHSYADVVGRDGSAVARAAPYLNGTLKKRCGLATNYRGITHPSLPNYIAMVAGTKGGIADNCTSCTTRASNLFGQLRRNGRSWRVFAEGMPGPCSHRSGGRYVKRHNPATYFPAIAADCRRFDVPMGGDDGPFARALRNDRLRAFTMVVPDMCNDTHDCPVSTGDAWLRRWVPRIAATPSYRDGRTVVFVTWDEGRGGDAGVDCLAHPGDRSCHVPLFVISALTAAGSRSSASYSHYSLLRTVEALLGMPRYLGRAATAKGLRAAFGLA
jgi:phosphatidylinositol-3-phosphatase